MDITIYHNPHCSKSRQALALLEEQGVTAEVVRYLETPPSKEEIRRLLSLLGIPAREMLRTGEAAYKELGLADTTKSEDEVVAAIAAHPELMQRPIVVAGDEACFGRPPENVLELIGK